MTKDFTSYIAYILPQFPGILSLYPIYIVSMCAENIVVVVEIVVGNKKY